jgi:hypothetical protein
MEYLNPHRLGDGLKLWEQGASQGGTLNALHALLAVSNGRGGGDYITGHEDFVGRWGGDRIAIVGDYAEPGDLPSHDGAEFLYERCNAGRNGWTDISDLAREFLSEQWELEFSEREYGWLRRTALEGSVFASDSGPALRPDTIINIIRPEDS